jgi:hypothetical protein
MYHCKVYIGTETYQNDVMMWLTVNPTIKAVDGELKRTCGMSGFTMCAYNVPIQCAISYALVLVQCALSYAYKETCIESFCNK